MTLHWWMHWFWVTLLVTLHASTGTGAPQSEHPHITENAELPIQPTLPEPLLKQSDRQGRAMYFDKAPVSTPTPSNITDNQTDKAVPILEEKSNNTDTNISTADIVANTTDPAHPSITWTAVNTTENITKLNTDTEDTESEQNSTQAPKKRNLTRPDVIKDDINIDFESRTERPLSLETSYQTRIPPNVGSSRMVVDQDGMDTGAIAGISFAALVLVALAGSTAFVLYRRRYLNKPQTLNDKCSNPDSSGYLDDSTIRDNSEEMYSLDNDSFLNSLEAMTIQNYWTDTVKHTKL